MEENQEGRRSRTRSGKDFKIAAGKRRREEDVEQLEENSSKKKMSKDDDLSVAAQIANLKDFFCKKLDTGLKKNRDDIADDNKANLQEITQRMDRTDKELEKLKKATNEEMLNIHQELAPLSLRGWRTAARRTTPTTRTPAQPRQPRAIRGLTQNQDSTGGPEEGQG